MTTTETPQLTREIIFRKAAQVLHDAETAATITNDANALVHVARAWADLADRLPGTETAAASGG